MRGMKLFKDKDDIIFTQLLLLKQEYKDYKITIHPTAKGYNIYADDDSDAIRLYFGDNSIFVANAYVGDELRGKGFYTSLLKRLLHLVELGELSSVVILSIRPYHFSFYKKLGFKMYVNKFQMSNLDKNVLINGYYGNYKTKDAKEIDINNASDRCLSYNYHWNKEFNLKLQSLLLPYKNNPEKLIEQSLEIVKNFGI